MHGVFPAMLPVLGMTVQLFPNIIEKLLVKMYETFRVTGLIGTELIITSRNIILTSPPSSTPTTSETRPTG
jgi:hypothetical protein